MTNALERIEAMLLSLRDQVDQQAEQLREVSALRAEFVHLRSEVKRLRRGLQTLTTRPAPEEGAADC